MDGLLSPVWAGIPAAEQTSDHAFLAALLEVEAVWAEVLADGQHVEFQDAHSVRRIANEWTHLSELSPERIAAAAPAGGNPVIPLLNAVRKVLSSRGESDAALHRGATSQDVMDTAQMLVAHSVTESVLADTARAADSLAALAAEHRGTVCIARTLTRHALPSSFGLRAASWLDGLTQAVSEVRSAAAQLPLQWGGAVGTQAGLVEIVGAGEARELTAQLAERLGLQNPGQPWHVQRQPILQLASALTSLTAAYGKIASDILLLQRPEIGELSEPRRAGRGGSSAMPQKQNPVFSVLIRSAALGAPGHMSTLYQAASLSVEERPDGAWQAEWPALRDLLRLSAGASARAAELLSGVVIHPQRMRQNLEEAGPSVFSERLVETFAPYHPQQRSGVRDAIARSAAEHTELAPLLREEIPTKALADQEFEVLMGQILDPAGFLGRTQEFVDAALAAHRQENL